jgi:hypothetical protein
VAADPTLNSGRRQLRGDSSDAVLFTMASAPQSARAEATIKPYNCAEVDCMYEMAVSNNDNTLEQPVPQPDLSRS